MEDKVASQTEDSAGDVAADLASLRADVTKLTSSIAELLRQQTAQTQDRVRVAVDSLCEQLSHSAADAKASVRDAGAELEASIERNPLTAVGTALAFGLALGLLGRRQR